MTSAESNSQMAKRVLAKIKPELLVWARESAGYNVGGAALALGIDDETLHAWEAGDGSPSIPQLRTAAGVYKRPLSVFFLQEVPKGFQVLSDFRRAENGPVPFSPELTQEIRVAHQRRELARELLADAGDEPAKLEVGLNFAVGAELAGRVVRDSLSIDAGNLNKFGGDPEGRNAFNYWRGQIEKAGVLVFQSTRVSSSEASGFALAYADLPVIVVNRKDAPTRRLFSLLHEYVHILLQQSGVSDLNLDLSKPAAQPAVELYCNAVAAASLIPKDLLQQDPLVNQHGDSFEWEETDLLTLSKRFGVSREALIIRLIGLGLSNWAFFQHKRAQYREEYLRLKERQAAAPPKAIPRNMPQETLSNFGKPFVGLVMGNYFQDRLTLSEVSGYLGLRTRHVEKLQRLAFGT